MHNSERQRRIKQLEDEIAKIQKKNHDDAKIPLGMTEELSREFASDKLMSQLHALDLLEELDALANGFEPDSDTLSRTTQT